VQWRACRGSAVNGGQSSCDDLFAGEQRRWARTEATRDALGVSRCAGETRGRKRPWPRAEKRRPRAFAGEEEASLGNGRLNWGSFIRTEEGP